MNTAAAERPTIVRYQILAATTAASVILYVHRIFISEVLKFPEIRTELNLSDDMVNHTYSAFFFSYALCQVPSGWFADRFGRRKSLFAYVVAWSIATALGGLAMGFASMFVVRLILGIAQAGAYPTSGGLISRWIPLTQRTLASAMVGAGGRMGGIIAPLLTSLLIAQWHVPWRGVMLLYGVVGVGIVVAMKTQPTFVPNCIRPMHHIERLVSISYNGALVWAVATCRSLSVRPSAMIARSAELQ